MSAGAFPFSNTRIMSLSASEFAVSIAKLGAHTLSDAGHPVFAVEDGSVEIQFAPAPKKTLGGLLALPQAVVTLAFVGGSAAAREAFVHRFDIAFQRGGG